MMRTKDLFRFIQERHAIYTRRFIEHRPKPWTDDPILRRFRFCNVYRELDTVTQWLAINWRQPHEADPDLWFAMMLARFINWPATLLEVGYPVPFRQKQVYSRLKVRSDSGMKVFTGAYLVRSREGENKMSYVVNTVLPPLWKDRKAIRADIFGDGCAAHSPTLASMHDALTKYYGVGSFMAAQILADIKYVPLLRNTADWFTFAASGPGSRRGMNRWLGRPKMSPWNEQEWRHNLAELQKQIAPLISKAHMPQLHAQDLQNCLCEFDKYERARTGEGRPRVRFDGEAA